jgi:hypothetical protein
MRSNSMRAAAVIATGLIFAWGSTASADFVSDFSAGGGLSEWGVNIPTVANRAGGQATDNWWPGATNANLPGTRAATGLTDGVYYYDLDDGVLAPDGGGQPYDAEFLGVGFDDDYLYIAIVSGQRPNNGATNYSPGDIHIETASGAVYGIEVGGDYGGAAGSEINAGDLGSTYAIKSDGHTVSPDGILRSDGTGGATTTKAWNGSSVVTTNLTYNTAQVAGALFLTDPDPSLTTTSPNAPSTQNRWLYDPIGTASTYSPVQLQTSGDSLGLADYSFIQSYNSNHSVIELKIARIHFGPDLAFGGQLTTVTWSASCGNDLIDRALKVTLPDNQVTVPEPASLALLVMGGLSFLGVRRWRKNG